MSDERRHSEDPSGDGWPLIASTEVAGGIEVLFFPRCYQVVGVDVAEDAIVLVKARVNRRDDRVSLIVNDLAVPDLTSAAGGAGAPVVVDFVGGAASHVHVGALAAEGYQLGPLGVALHSDDGGAGLGGVPAHHPGAGPGVENPHSGTEVQRP